MLPNRQCHLGIQERQIVSKDRAIYSRQIAKVHLAIQECQIAGLQAMILQ
jgi:hypothetical protein